MQPASSRSRLPQLLVLLGFVLLLIFGFWQQQSIRDYVKLFGYDPPVPVSQLADDIALTDPARRVFYVNHPALQDREAFNSSCSSHDEHTIVLGCYYPVDRGIFLFQVGDERLRGVVQVTAAHEMLHAGYDRLSNAERKRIDALLQDFYDTKLADARVKSVIDSYRQSEPNDVLNEMHSILATEVETLTPELETYYTKYFSSRAKVVGYARTYQAEFATRQAQVSSYDAELENMKLQITINTEQIESQEARINRMRSEMDSQRTAGNIEAYNASVPFYNNMVESYNGLITQTRALISRYNELVATRNEVALQVTDLAHSIDSKFQQL